ncbi:hypothetical protein ACFWUW_15755 [Streptomyces sp. NPDC058655]|uniref:hypothetical protein n=1 Tax=Streptomyces sp. NPDC058655 TaxID=3346577 RepID=UPI003665C343
MSITGWRVHFTRRDAPWPRVVTPLMEEFSELFARLNTGLDDHGVPEGEPFLIAPDGSYDVALNKYFTSYFQPRATPALQPETPSQATGEQAQNNLRRLRQESADLRRTLHLYEEAIRQLAIENDALRQQATVIPLPARADQRPRL